jgi:membrane-bound lytic murein transglycosylase D
MSAVGRAQFRMLLLTGAGALALAGRPAAAAKPEAGAAASGEPSAAERRAVRGRSIDEDLETPELRELRRFEQAAFSNGGEGVQLPGGPADDELVPPPLPGRWGGSGDVPAPLRSPEAAVRSSRPPPTPEAAWLRSLKLPELPVRWEPQVLRFLEFFKNDPKGRAVMTSFLRRMGRFDGVITRALEREGVTKDLIYLAMIESGFEPKALSNKNAGGVWQFMPDAGRAYGLEVSYWVDVRRDPERAAEAAARYLKDLHTRFGSWPLAFAAYHAGYGAILSAITRFNTNDYWELCKHEAGLPWETTLYVPKILAVALIGYNREAFGFGDVAADPPLSYDRVEARPGTGLAVIARAAGTTLDVIQALNPELVRDRTPPDRPAMKVRVPAGSAGLYAEGIERARAVEHLETYVIRFGESLDDVAKAHGLSTRDLRRLNGVRDAAELRGGATVMVPPRPANGAPPESAHAADPGDDLILVAVPERAWQYKDRERVFYRTREGDTLEEIATAFQVQDDDVVEWNNLDADAKLHPRMILQLFVARSFDRGSVALLDPEKLRVVTLGSEEFHQLEAAHRGKTRLTYAARPGDTLAKIARRYGLAPADLARVNRLSYSSELSPGQRVVVYSPTPELPREVTEGRSGPHKRPLAAAVGKGAGAHADATTVAAKTKPSAPGKPAGALKTTGVAGKPAVEKPRSAGPAKPGAATKR